MLRNHLKFSACMLLICSMFTVFTGCRTNTSNTGSPVVNTRKSADKYQPIDGKRYKITWSFYQTAPIAKDAVMLKYWDDKFNVDIQVVDIDNNKHDEILNLKMASGEVPDYFQASNPALMKKYVDQGMAAEIPEDVLNKYAPNVMKRINNDVPGAMQYCKVNGKIYALPNYSTFPARNPIVWRGDWLKKVGIQKTPETLQEFEDAIYKFANNDPDGNGKKDTYGLSKSGLDCVYGAFGYIPTMWKAKDGKLVYGAVQPEMKQALALIHKWYVDGVLDPEFITGENQGGYWALSHAFIHGRIGFTGLGQTYHWQPNFYSDDKPGIDREELAKVNKTAADSLVMGNPPIGPNGSRGTIANPSIKPAKNMFGKGVIDEPDKLGKILQIFDYVYASYDNFNVASNGIPGEMWNYVDKKALDGNTYKVIQMTDKYDKSKTGFDLNANFAHTALQLFTPSFPENSNSMGPNWKWAYQIGADKYRIYDELQVALPSQSRVKAETDKLVEETYVAIIVGEKPIDYFDQFVKAWRAAGGDQLEKEANDWYKTVKK